MRRAVIRIDVRLYATLRRYTPDVGLGEAMNLDMEEGSTLQQLFERLGVPPGEVKRIIVNGIARDISYRLLNGDRVAIFPPVAGG